MADVTLTLDGDPESVTLATTTVRRIVVPNGCRSLIFSSSIDWYEQNDATQAIADGAAITAADAKLIPAGLWSSQPTPPKSATTPWPQHYVLAYGSAAGTLYVQASSRRIR